jgi:hypothetical protein
VFERSLQPLVTTDQIISIDDQIHSNYRFGNLPH